MKNGLTLLEIVVTLIVIVFVIALTVPNFSKMQEEALNKEAFGNLKRMQEAEKFYNMEMNRGVNYYYPSSGSTTDIGSINANLRLDLPNPNPNWTYTAKSDGCVQAARNGGTAGGTDPKWANNRIWRLRMVESGDGPNFPSGACP